jgi:hypothetical protein
MQIEGTAMPESFQDFLREEAKGTQLEPLIIRLIDDSDKNPDTLIWRLLQSFQMAMDQALANETLSAHQSDSLRAQLLGMNTLCDAKRRYILTPDYTPDEQAKYFAAIDALKSAIEVLLWARD